MFVALIISNWAALIPLEKVLLKLNDVVMAPRVQHDGREIFTHLVGQELVYPIALPFVLRPAQVSQHRIGSKEDTFHSIYVVRGSAAVKHACELSLIDQVCIPP